MDVQVMVTLPGGTEPRKTYVAQHAHSSFTLHPSSRDAHAEETESEDWPAVLPTKQDRGAQAALRGLAAPHA